MNQSDSEKLGLALIEPDRNAYIAEHGPDAVAEYDGTLEHLLQLHTMRKTNAADFSTYNLPELPESEADTIFERIREAERRVAAPTLHVKNYENGVAVYDDEPLVIEGLARVILTTEHATQQMRTRDGETKPKEPDYGTGGLGIVLQEDTGAALITPLGRQTGDANDDAEHWLKNDLGKLIALPTSQAHMSIHQTGRTQAEKLTDLRSFGVMLGIGEEHTEETRETAEQMVQIGKKYDIRTGINQKFIKMEPKAPTRPVFTPKGDLKTIAFAANGANTTRAFSQRQAEAIGKPFTAIQVEFSNVLLHAPLDWKNNPGEKSQRMGVYLGYLLGKEFVELLAAAQGQH